MTDDPSHWPDLGGIPSTPPSAGAPPPSGFAAPSSHPGGAGPGGPSAPGPVARGGGRRPIGTVVVVAVAVVILLVVAAIAVVATRARDTAAPAVGTDRPTTTPGASGRTTPSTPGTTSGLPRTGPSTPGTTTDAPAFHPAPVSWKPCGKAGYDCATVEVPLDYDHPDGRTIELALERHRATDPSARIGSVFFNPGGPGGSGVDALPQAVSDLPEEVTQRFDVVGWDPRGVGQSAAIHCDDGAIELYRQGLDEVPAPAAAEDAAKAWAQECQDRSGDLLPFVGTVDVAHDLDVLREAVGDDQLTYLGVSYGTEIGLVYAERFPTHLRAMILDGVVDPTVDPDTANLEQSVAVDKAIDAFFRWCSARTSCELHDDPAGAIDDLNEAAEAGELQGAVLGKTVTLSPSLAELAVVTATYDSSTWPFLATAVDEALQGDTRDLMELINSYFGGVSLGDNAAVDCIDSPRPTRAEIDELATKSAAEAPRTGPFNANSGLVCLYWPAPAKPVPTSYRAAGSPTIMVWGTTGDNATPYKNAVHIASVLEHAQLVTLDANRHAAMGENDCVKQIQGDYLVDLTVPPADTRC